MPHAAHFLERLDRVPRSLSDFALDLYRDEERVRWILHYAHLPKEQERVALALQDGGEGPYIVVTREGRFVTALGHGMKPTNLTVLNRSQVDAFSARVEDARRRHELAKEVVAEGKRPVDMMGLLTTRPSTLSRDEFTAIAAWVPLMNLHFLSDIYKAGPALDSFRDSCLATSPKRFRKAFLGVDAVKARWSISHGIAARYVLATMGELVWVEPFADRWTLDHGPTWLATDERILAVALRGAWAAARMGKPLLPIYKRILLASEFETIRFDAILAATAIGLRHAHLHDDARRIVGTMRDGGDEPTPFQKQTMTAAWRALDDPEAAMGAAIAHGARVAAAYAPLLPADSPNRFVREEDVPRDLALMLAANDSVDCTNPFAFAVLPWVARLANPEELYLPDDLLHVHKLLATPDRLAAIYERQVVGLTGTTVTRETPKIGRNDACTCGSGKKSKKCCGK